MKLQLGNNWSAVWCSGLQFEGLNLSLGLIGWRLGFYWITILGLRLQFGIDLVAILGLGLHFGIYRWQMGVWD